MIKKISSLIVVATYLVNITISTAYAGQAIILTDEQLDQVHAEGLFLNFDSSFGSIDDLQQSNFNAPKALSGGTIRQSPNSNIKLIEITRPTAPKPTVPKATPSITPKAPTIPDIAKVPTVDALIAQGPSAPTIITPKIVSAPTPNIQELAKASNPLSSLNKPTIQPLQGINTSESVHASTPFVTSDILPLDISNNTPPSPISNIKPIIQDTTFNAGPSILATNNPASQAITQPLNILDKVLGNAPIVSDVIKSELASNIPTITAQPTTPSAPINSIVNVPKIDQLALATPTNTSVTDLIKNLSTPQNILAKSPVANLSPIDVITPPAPKVPVINNVNPTVSIQPMPTQPAAPIAPTTPVTIIPTNPIASAGPSLTSPTPMLASNSTSNNLNPLDLNTSNAASSGLLNNAATQQLAQNNLPTVDSISNAIGGNLPTVDSITNQIDNNPAFTDNPALNNNPAIGLSPIELDFTANSNGGGNDFGFDLDIMQGSDAKTNGVPTNIAVNTPNGSTNVVDVSGLSQQNLSALINVNAAGSIVPVILNLTINVNSTVQSVSNASTIDITNLQSFQFR